MKCLVTGANGFIGQALCNALQERKASVIAALRSAQTGPWDRSVMFDLIGEPLRPSEIHGVSCIFHLAGKAHAFRGALDDDRAYYRINTEGTRKLLESAQAAGVRRFVYFSSVKAMSEGGVSILDETAECQPETSYGRSKLEAERLVLEGGYVPEPVVLRLTMVYGPTRTGNLPRMVEAIAKGRFPPLPEVGNKRSMVHVEDVVQAAQLAADKPQASGKIYIVTDGEAYSTRQIYSWICRALSRSVPAWSIPAGLLKSLAKLGDAIGWIGGRRFVFDSDALDKLIGSACYSSEKIRKELGFRAKWDLQAALPSIIESIGMKS